MTKIYELNELVTDEKKFNGLVDTLVQSSMKANYIDLVTVHGSEDANERMVVLYGDSWTAHQTDIWQWFDDEMASVRERA